ncbi:MAG: DUF4185 domain-containing protein [Actinobacteria bacterium]|nr:DUF4185 domain-containing protein [Actinomycetota bacterium]
MPPVLGSPVIGPASLVGGPWPWSHLDAVVLTGERLDHYRRELVRPDRPWVRLGTVSAAATGPGRLARRGRRLLATVPEAGGPAVYEWRAGGWEQTGVAISPLDAPDVTAEGFGAHLAAESRHVRAVATTVAAGRGYALADEDGSVFGWVAGPDDAWERDSCLRLCSDETFAVAPTESVKLAQVTGDVDATPTPWGRRAPTLSSSQATAGVRGTDLGVRVDHAGRTFLLFGDTHWSRRPWLATRDAIAEVVPDGPVAPGLLPSGLPGVRFHGSPLKLVGRRAGRVTMREYDVPLDGFSAGGELFVFFSSNHFRRHRVMGRSVLARAVDPTLRVDPAARRRPVAFEVVGAFSERHFVNVSVQLRPAAAVPGCGTDGEVLLVWGTGPYRASEPRLALLDQAALAALGAGAGVREAGVRYWAGDDWSDAERDARPLFAPAAIGELSVRWVPALGRYVMLTDSAPEDPIGLAVALRTAALPQGPWSTRTRLLDWVTTGMALDPHTRFIKSAADDEVGDRVFRAQARGTGAAYAPYLFDAEADGDEVVLRYTLSTWNPYQVVLMQHRLDPRTL